jgi:ABC-2 type transport system permease protein
MSIRDQGYQRYEGARTPPAGRWLVVLRRTLRMTARQPWVIAILIIALLPTLVAAAVMYFQMKLYAMVPAEQLAAAHAVDPGLLVYTFQVSWYGTPVLAFLMALFAGGSAVADDIRMNAFQFYFARPLSRDQYLLGKTLAVAVLVWCVAVAPALLLAVVRLALLRAGVDSPLRLALLPARGLVLGTLEAVVLTVPAVALSSLSPRRGLAQGGYAALFFLPWILGWIVSALVRSAWPMLLAVPAGLRAVGAPLFAYDAPPDERLLPWLPALAVMAALVAGSVALVRWRLASVEVVSG